MSTRLLALVLLFTLVSTRAIGSSCDERAKKLSGLWMHEVACYCSANELARVHLSLPSGLYLEAVCGLHNAKGESIDLRKHSINMDEYDSTGNSFDGEFHLKGSLVVSGVIRVEPGDAGDLWFTPDRPIGNRETPFGNELQVFKFVDEASSKKFQVTKKMRSAKCLEAPAKVRFRDILVSRGESDSNGTYPKEVTVLHLGPYRPCAGR